MDVVDSEVKTNEVVVDAGVVYTLPAGADFIMCYSVAEGEEDMAQLVVHYRKHLVVVNEDRCIDQWYMENKD